MKKKTVTSGKQEYEDKFIWILQSKKKIKKFIRDYQVVSKTENQKIENECLLLWAENNTINSNFIKAESDNTLKNHKCRLCSDRWIIYYRLIIY